jgi:large subunit ribosomal protein L24
MSIQMIKKNDNVLVIAGKDKGKTGKILSVFLKTGKVVVEGINQYKKHIKPSGKYPQGGIIDFNAPMEASNVMVICPGCSKSSRVKVKNTGKDKRRICGKCGEVIDAA